MSYKQNSPIPVAQGGTGDTSTTPYAVICGGTTGTGAFEPVSGLGTSGQILTSQGAGALPNWVTNAAVLTIDGDSGSATGNTITFNAHSNAGSSVDFTASGSTVDLKVTDANANTIIGGSAGNASISGTLNTGLGASILTDLTSGVSNVAIGYEALFLLVTGSDNVAVGDSALSGLATSGSRNVALGHAAGSNYTTSESDNICIGHSVSGTVSESNVLRVGNGTGTSSGQQNKAFISGIRGITSATADQVLTVNSSNQVASVAAGTSGYVLTSNGSGSAPSWQAAAASGIVTIDGNSGSVTGSTVSIVGTYTTSGSTLSFAAASSTELTIALADSNSNIVLGTEAQAGGGLNTGLGYQVLYQQNGSATYNTVIGYQAGYDYTGSESSNICIGASVLGVTGESHALHIGVSTGTGNGALNKAYICGINGITVSDADQVLIIDSSNQIGSIAHGTSGQAFISGGSGANPSWGTLSVGGGGTGDTSFTAYGVICGGTTTTGALQSVSSLGTSGQVLTSQGASSLPHWTTVSGGITTINGDSGSATGSTVTISGGTTGLTTTATSATMDLTGTLIVGNGGTGATTLTGVLIGNGTSAVTGNAITQYDVLIGGASNAITSLAPSATAGVPMISAGSSANPTWGTGFTINSSGYTNNANQPAFFTYLNSNVTNVTGDGTNYQVLFGSTRFDQSSSVSSGTFTAPVAGIYFFSAGVQVTSLGAGHTTGYMLMVKNAYAEYSANPYVNPIASSALSPAGTLGLNSTIMFTLAINDTVKVYINVTGSTKTVGVNSTGGSLGNGFPTFFAGYLVA